MSKHSDKLILFSIGALGYGLIELLWRGYTHWSMLWAGGICFVLFEKISKKMKNASVFLKALVGSATITLIEFIFGVIFNIILKKNVWDYSRMPLNLAGQVCALYSFFWLLLSLIFIPFASFIGKKIRTKMQ